MPGELRELGDAAVLAHHHALAGHEGGEREVDDCFAVARVGEGGGENVHATLLQLGDARRDGELLDGELHADLLRDRLTEVDVVADDRAGFWVHETVRLIRSQHAADEVAFLLDGIELVCLGGGGKEASSSSASRMRMETVLQGGTWGVMLRRCYRSRDSFAA